MIRQAATPAKEAFICSVFVRQRLRLAAESFSESEMRAAIFRMPESILGEAMPALGRLCSNLALLAWQHVQAPSPAGQIFSPAAG